jgi:hypothetical protein
VGEVIEGESIEPPGDIDEFRFEGVVGQEVAVFLQGVSGDGSDSQRLALYLVDRAGTVDETVLGDPVTSSGAAQGLTDDGRSTGRVTLPRTGSYTVRVQNQPGAPYFGLERDKTARGAYRFLVHLVDRAPEEVAQAVAVGDTIESEGIEPPGDIDEFSFEGVAGQEVAVYLQGLTGKSSDRFELRLVQQAGTAEETILGNVASSPGNDASLEGHSTGTVTLPETATYTVRVQGRDSKVDAGAYRFHVRDEAGG